jgi:hypothetical protein
VLAGRQEGLLLARKYLVLEYSKGCQSPQHRRLLLVGERREERGRCLRPECGRKQFLLWRRKGRFPLECLKYLPLRREKKCWPHGIREERKGT